MKKLIVLLFLICYSSAFSQMHINQILKRQLDSISALDQKYREILSLLADPIKKESVAKSLSLTVQQADSRYWKLQNEIDSANVVFVEAIFSKYGYPGKTLVGTPTNEAAWYVIQHSQRIKRYLPVIRKAAEKQELPFRLYAMMLDRELCSEGKEQLYGT